MKYKTIVLESKKRDSILTELRFNVASARVLGTELLRIDIPTGEDPDEMRRIYSASLRILKEMKQDGSIQLYATCASFGAETTEAKYLMNKYPEIFDENNIDRIMQGSIYIKV